MKDERIQLRLAEQFLKDWTTLRVEGRCDPISWLMLKFGCTESAARRLFDKVNGDAIVNP